MSISCIKKPKNFFLYLKVVKRELVKKIKLNWVYLSDCSDIQRIKMGFLRYLILKFLLLKKICSLSRQPSTLPASWPRVGRGELALSHLRVSPPPSAPGSFRVTALWPPAARGFSPAWPPHAPPPPKPAATAPAASAAPGPHHPATPRRLPTLW